MNDIHDKKFLTNRAVIIINVYLSTSRIYFMEESHNFYGDSPRGSLHLPARWIWAWLPFNSTQPLSSTIQAMKISLNETTEQFRIGVMWEASA